MFAVISYYNYRKEASFKILHIFNNFEYAKKMAYWYAKQEYGKNNVTDEVLDNYLYVDDILVTYTRGNGCDEFVFGVIKLPKIDTEYYESDTDSE
jgi:hypothetical protein